MKALTDKMHIAATTCHEGMQAAQEWKTIWQHYYSSIVRRVEWTEKCSKNPAAGSWNVYVGFLLLYLWPTGGESPHRIFQTPAHYARRWGDAYHQLLLFCFDRLKSYNASKIVALILKCVLNGLMNYSFS